MEDKRQGIFVGRVAPHRLAGDVGREEGVGWGIEVGGDVRVEALIVTAGVDCKGTVGEVELVEFVAGKLPVRRGEGGVAVGRGSRDTGIGEAEKSGIETREGEKT